MWTSEEKLQYIYAFMRYNNKPIVLDFWQDDYILNRSRFISLLKSRQTGFSFIVAAKGLVKAMDPSRTKYTKQFVSYNEDDAQEKIRYAREFYESIPPKYRKPLLHATSTMLEFKDIGGTTTSRLISLPCRPPRGKNGDVCLDEFAIYSEKLQASVYQAAVFCTSRTKGCIEVGSTPLGAIGRFYDICCDNTKYPDYYRYSIPWWYAASMCNNVKEAIIKAPNMSQADRVSKYASEQLLKIYNETTSDDFSQECECAFIDANASYIPLELIYANTPGHRESDIPNIASDEDYYNASRDIEIHAYSDIDELILGYTPDMGTLYLGYDVARDRDAAAIYILGFKGGYKRSVYRWEKRGATFEEQKDLIRKIMRRLPIYRACMDSTGMGAPLAEELHKDFGDKIEGVTFTLATKEQLAIGVKLALERREYLLENSRELHAQIHSIKRIATGSGNFRYDSEHNSRGHADSFWALSLATHAIGRGSSGNSYYSNYLKAARGDAPTKGGIITKGRTIEEVMARVKETQYSKG